MKNIKYILIFAVFIASGKLFAQQDPSYTLYKYNMNIINPAFVGTSGNTELNLNIRNQWANLDESPKTQSVSFSKPVNDKIGIGFSIVNDKIDIIKETDFTVDFSYKLKISETSDIYLGIKAGGYTFKADLLSKGILNDPAFGENVSRFNAIFGAGALFKIKKFYATISTPNILAGKRVDNDDYAEAKSKPHVFAGAGYTFDINDNVKFSPSFMSRFVKGAPSSIDLTGMFDIYDKVELGGSYRLDESISGIALIKMKDWFQFGYAYEFTTSDVKNYSDGTHEIMLRFNL
ncbi:MAG: hypothetical protein COA67_04340 [Lutibacter sp.]|nr:MAG: hypothetical protein COA67_04340 [Lutibacter sp.]